MNFELEKRIETIHGETCDMLRISTNEGVVNLAIPIDSEVEIDMRSIDSGERLNFGNHVGWTMSVEGIVRLEEKPKKPKKKKKSKKLKAKIKVVKELIDRMKSGPLDQRHYLMQQLLEELESLKRK